MNFGSFGLGNFAGRLNPGDLNGALKNAGSTFQLPDAPETQLQMPTGNGGPSVGAEPPPAPAEPPPQAADAEAPGKRPLAGVVSDAPLKGVINLQTIGSLVGSYFGGPMGGQIGGALGGMAKGNVDQQRRRGTLA